VLRALTMPPEGLDDYWGIKDTGTIPTKEALIYPIENKSAFP
jgi:hypothetical protein